MDFTPSPHMRQLHEIMGRSPIAPEVFIRLPPDTGNMQILARYATPEQQQHGAAGVSDDFVLARSYAQARGLRIADGPDGVHLNQIGRLELAPCKTSKES